MSRETQTNFTADDFTGGNRARKNANRASVKPEAPSAESPVVLDDRPDPQQTYEQHAESESPAKKTATTDKKAEAKKTTATAKKAASKK